MENETLIEGNMLFSIGILVILIGFLLILIGIALSLYQESKSTQSHSNRTDAFGRKTRFESTPETPFNEWSPAKESKTEIKTGGVIMIGPIPIIFGSDKEGAKTAAILAIILMLLSLLILRASF